MPFTPKQRSLLSLASELGRTKFAPRAPQWDASASFPFANYDDLRDAGLLRLCVPEAHGGLGADYPTYMMLAAEIGRHCGATALTWNMHICSTMWTGVLADGIPMNDEQRSDMRAVAPCTSTASSRTVRSTPSPSARARRQRPAARRSVPAHARKCATA